jgi:hypothetical protein
VEFDTTMGRIIDDRITPIKRREILKRRKIIRREIIVKKQ